MEFAKGEKEPLAVWGQRVLAKLAAQVETARGSGVHPACLRLVLPRYLLELLYGVVYALRPDEAVDRINTELRRYGYLQLLGVIVELGDGPPGVRVNLSNDPVVLGGFGGPERVRPLNGRAG